MARFYMNYNSNTSFDFNSVTEFAGNYAKKESPKASKILDFFISKSKREYIKLCFTYLRWVDDIVDGQSLNIYQKKKFIEHQKNLISLLHENGNVAPSVIEEACLIHFAEYAISTGNLLLLDEVKNMVDAMSMDVYRLENSSLFSNNELNHYIELMSKSFFNILYCFSLPKSGYREEFYLGAKFTTIALMIRDLEEDIDAGFINIGAEDINRYKLDIKNLKEDKNLSHWIADRIKYIFGLLYEEAALLKHLPLKFRIITYYSLIYRLPWVIRAKVYGYSLKYISERTFLQEIKAYLISFFISINIFLKGFIFTSKNNYQILQVEKNNKPYLSLIDALKIAAKFTRKRGVWLWILAIFYFQRKHRKYFYLCYSYLRWVDDYVDNPQGDKLKKLEFIENQLKLIKDLSNEENVDSAYPINGLKFKEEFFLYYYIKYAKHVENYNLIFEVKRVVESIWLDANRLFNGGIFSQDELSHYIDIASRPNSNIINYFLYPTIKTLDENKIIGKFLGYVAALRDFFEDLEAGYINISREEISEYNLNMDDFKNDKKRFDWMADKYPELLELLHEEISILKSMPVKAKLYFLPPYSVVLTMLLRIKVYDYKFGEKLKKEMSKELKVYLQSFSLILQMYLKVFL